jgi:protein-disulfide isomerase
MSTKHSLAQFLTSTRGLFYTGLAFGVVGALALGFAVHVRSEAIKASRELAASPNADGTFSPEMLENLKPVDDQDHVLGEGKVTLIEYGDYECPFCRQFHPTVKALMEKNKGQLRWVFRHLPIPEVHPQAEALALAAECAADQGRFWQMTDVIYADEQPDAAKAPDYAKQAGVKDAAKFATCLDDAAGLGRVANDANNAIAIGAEGTPFTILMDGKGHMQALPGAIPEEAMQSVIDTLLAQ